MIHTAPLSLRPLLLVAFSLIFCAMNLLAQTQADVNVSEGGYGIVKTNLNMQYQQSWGQIDGTFAARASYEAFTNRWLTLSANARYSSYRVDFKSHSLSDGYDPDAIGLNDIHLLGQIGVTATARARLFGKPVMALAMINTDWGTGGFERISATVMALVMLRANRDTQFGIGPLLMLNTTSKIPVFPVFMYRHRFDRRWLLNLYGGMFGVDYTPTSDDLFCIGADIDVKSFYFNPHSESLPRVCRFTQTSFCPIVKYRRRLAPNLYIEAKGGVALKMSSRVNGRTGTREYFTCTQKDAPFLQASVAYSL